MKIYYDLKYENDKIRTKHPVLSVGGTERGGTAAGAESHAGLEDGSEIIGANQENAAFPVTLCAERTAIFAAQAQHPELSIVALAVAARNDNGFTEDPVSPCGSCRQVILEIEQRYGKPMKIYLYGTKGVYVIDTIRDLLPLCFVEESMR